MKTPNNQTEYDKRMESTGQLLTAIGWERAALVAMIVEPDFGHGKQTTSSSGLESATEFANRKYHGLRSRDTVLLYARAWLDRFPRPNWGEVIELPTDDFPPTRQGSDGYESDDNAKVVIGRIIERHGTAIVQNALVEKMEKDMPFDIPPKMPWKESANTSYRLFEVLGGINLSINAALTILSEYEIGSDPTTDQMLAESMNVVEQYEHALREVMGLDVMT
jgi:hypothetical protein